MVALGVYKVRTTISHPAVKLRSQEIHLFVRERGANLVPKAMEGANGHQTKLEKLTYTTKRNKTRAQKTGLRKRRQGKG